MAGCRSSSTRSRSDGAPTAPGESEYLINGARARLRDVVELLGEGRLGANELVVVGQGTVDSALSLRPEERRQLFEEAAGVKNLQVRKNEALARLARARDNLTRVTDLIAELKPQVRRLGAAGAACRRSTTPWSRARGRWCSRRTGDGRSLERTGAGRCSAPGGGSRGGIGGAPFGSRRSRRSIAEAEERLLAGRCRGPRGSAAPCRNARGADPGRGRRSRRWPGVWPRLAAAISSRRGGACRRRRGLVGAAQRRGRCRSDARGRDGCGCGGAPGRRPRRRWPSLDLALMAAEEAPRRGPPAGRPAHRRRRAARGAVGANARPTRAARRRSWKRLAARPAEAQPSPAVRCVRPPATRDRGRGGRRVRPTRPPWPRSWRRSRLADAARRRASELAEKAGAMRGELDALQDRAEGAGPAGLDPGRGRLARPARRDRRPGRSMAGDRGGGGRRAGAGPAVAGRGADRAAGRGAWLGAAGCASGGPGAAAPSDAARVDALAAVGADRTLAEWIGGDRVPACSAGPHLLPDVETLLGAWRRLPAGWLAVTPAVTWPTRAVCWCSAGRPSRRFGCRAASRTPPRAGQALEAIERSRRRRRGSRPRHGRRDRGGAHAARTRGAAVRRASATNARRRPIWKPPNSRRNERAADEARIADELATIAERRAGRRRTLAAPRRGAALTWTSARRGGQRCASAGRRPRTSATAPERPGSPHRRAAPRIEDRQLGAARSHAGGGRAPDAGWRPPSRRSSAARERLTAERGELAAAVDGRACRRIEAAARARGGRRRARPDAGRAGEPWSARSGDAPAGRPGARVAGRCDRGVPARGGAGGAGA